MNLSVANTSIFRPMADTIFRPMADTIKLMMQRPLRRQVAALCYRFGKSGPEVLMITSRSTKRWILPKGWPMANHSGRKTARIEAYEEAGIIGKASKRPIGEFISYKGLGNGFKVRTCVTVYAIRVDKQLKKFPEKGERELAWLSPELAREICNESGLRELLSSEQVRNLLKEKLPA